MRTWCCAPRNVLGGVGSEVGEARRVRAPTEEPGGLSGPRGHEGGGDGTETPRVFEKFNLYYGHRARVKNQARAIAALYAELEECARNGDITRAL